MPRNLTARRVKNKIGRGKKPLPIAHTTVFLAPQPIVSPLVVPAARRLKDTGIILVDKLLQDVLIKIGKTDFQNLKGT